MDAFFRLRTICNRISAGIGDRPLCCGCALFMLFCTPLLFSPAAAKIALCAVCAAAGLFFLVIRRRTVRFTVVLLRAAVCTFICAAVCVTAFVAYDLTAKKTVDLAQSGREARVTLYLEKAVYETSYGSLYEATVTSIDGGRTFGVRTLVSTNRQTQLYRILEGIVRFEKLTGSSAYTDYSSNYRSKRILTQTDGSSLWNTGETPFTVSYPAYLLREAISGRIKKVFSGDAAGLIDALITGQRTGLSEEIRRDFRTLGISHLLAISGLHLSILFFIFDKLMLRLRVPFYLRTVLLMLIVFVYMAVCGFSPSITRAGIMLELLLIARLTGRDSDPFTTLFFTGALMCLISPYTVFSVAFLLSFFSVFGILAVDRLFIEKFGDVRKRPWMRVLSMLLVSLAAQLAVLPASVFTFGSISFGAPLFSFFFSLLIFIILCCAPVLLAISFIPAVGQLLCKPLSAFCTLTVRLSSLARYVRFQRLPVDHILLIVFAVPAAIFLFLLVFGEKKKKWGVCICACYLLLGAAAAAAPFLKAPCVYADVCKQNDMVVTSARGKCAIIDLSDGSRSYTKETCAFLKAETGKDGPDEIVLTHYHKKHLSSFEYLCAAAYPERLYLPEPQDDEETRYFEELSAIAGANSVEVRVFGCDRETPLAGGICLNYDTRQREKAKSHPSFAFSLSARGSKIVFLSAFPPIAGEEKPTTAYFCLHGPKFKRAPDLSSYAGVGRAVFRDPALAEVFAGLSDDCIQAQGAYRFVFG